MNEVKLLGALLLLLLAGAYFSWTDQDTKPEETTITIFDVKKDQVEGLAYYAKTTTVTVSFRDGGGEKYAWFEVQTKNKKRSFVANEKFDEHLKKLAPLQASRTLGRDLAAEELKQTELSKPQKKLEIAFSGKKKVFEVGGRTSGSKDHYVRAAGDTEVFLVEAKTISDLEFPDSIFMERKLRKEKPEDIEKVVISSSVGTRTGLHKNRSTPTDEFWADESAPDTKSETLENYIDKLDKLAVDEYASPEDLTGAIPILEVTWIGENEKALGTTKLVRKGEDKQARYYATSPVVRVPVKVLKFIAEQLERDLKTVMESK